MGSRILFLLLVPVLSWSASDPVPDFCPRLEGITLPGCLPQPPPSNPPPPTPCTFIEILLRTCPSNPPPGPEQPPTPPQDCVPQPTTRTCLYFKNTVTMTNYNQSERTTSYQCITYPPPDAETPPQPPELRATRVACKVPEQITCVKADELISETVSGNTCTAIVCPDKAGYQKFNYQVQQCATQQPNLPDCSSIVEPTPPPCP